MTLNLNLHALLSVPGRYSYLFSYEAFKALFHDLRVLEVLEVRYSVLGTRCSLMTHQLINDLSHS